MFVINISLITAFQKEFTFYKMHPFKVGSSVVLV